MEDFTSSSHTSVNIPCLLNLNGFFISSEKMIYINYFLLQAWLLWRANRWHELVARCLWSERDHFMMERCVHLALLCLQEGADDRPAMDEVVKMLGGGEGAAVVLPEPKQPAYFNVRPVGTEMSASCDMSASITLPR
jgi:hypothetical protein